MLINAIQLEATFLNQANERNKNTNINTLLTLSGICRSIVSTKAEYIKEIQTHLLSICLFVVRNIENQQPFKAIYIFVLKVSA